MKSHQERLMLFSCRVFFSLIISACLAFPVLAYDQAGGRDMTTDDMLIYTIKDLHARMQTIIRENNRLKTKSEAVRKRILFLRQEMRSYEDRRFELLEETVQLTDLIKLDERDTTITKNRKINLEKYMRHLESESEGLRNDLEQGGVDADSLEQYIEKLQKGLSKLEEKEKDKGFRVLKKRYDQEKGEFQISIKGSNDRLKRIQKELAILERDVSRLNKEKQAALFRKRALREDLQEVKSSLLLDMGERKSLEGDKKRREELTQKKKLEIKEEIEQLEAYNENLELAVKKFYNANETVMNKNDIFYKTVDDVQKMYDLEYQLLEEKESILKRYANHVAKVQQGKENRLNYGDTHEDLLAKKKVLADEIDFLSLQIEKEESISLSLMEEMKGVSAEIEDIEEDIKSKERKFSGRGKSSRERAIKLEIADKKEAIRDAEKGVKNIRHSNRRMLSQLAQLENNHAKLNSSAKKALEDWQAILPDEGGQTGSNMIQKQSNARRQSRLAEEVGALKLRSSILSSSMATIETKYNADKIAVREFRMEKEQLLEYLSMLINENKGLAVKIESLQEGLGVLNAP